jgi:RNA polymerase sigma-70 factor (ECF subfamily)
MKAGCRERCAALAFRLLETWDNLEQLYLRHSRSVFRRARELLADDEAARDATHEVFMRVVRAGGKVPGEPTCTGWLHRVTTNLCLNQLRDRSRQSNLLSSKHVPDTFVQANGESRAAVLEILGRVPAELQEVVVYFFLDELTYDEIARLMGVSRRTVSNRLASFRDLMTRLFPNPRLAS